MRSSTSHRHRVFFALTFDATFCQHLAQWCRHVPLMEGRWVTMANYHLTLSFLGDADDRALESLIGHQFEALPPFELSFGVLGFFAKPQVLFVHPDTIPPTLLQLQRQCTKLKNSLRLGKADEKFVPHITLAREVQAPISAPAQPLQLHSRHRHFSLMVSQSTRDGVVYRALQQWPLRPPLRPQPR